MTRRTENMAALDTRFAAARKEFSEALEDARETGRVAGSYSSAFNNPYADDVKVTRTRLDNAVIAFGPLMRAAIENGHHGSWISRRLPGGFHLAVLDNLHYGAAVSRLGVALEQDVVDSGISNRDTHVQWPS